MYSRGTTPPTIALTNSKPVPVSAGSNLTSASGLAHKLANALGCLANRLAIRNLRTPHVGVDTELAFEPIDNNFEMKLAHSADDRLTGFLIGRDFVAWVFGRETLQSETELLLIGSGLRFNSLRDDGGGKFERFKDDRPGFFTDRIAGRDLLETGNRDNLAGGCLLDVLAFVRVHSHDPAHAFFRAASRVQRIRSCFESA